MFLFLWETPDGSRHWEAIKKSQTEGFLKKLIDYGVNHATIMVAFNPTNFIWILKEYHNNRSDVTFQKINQEICGSTPVVSQHKPLDIEDRPKIVPKYGWIAPDGRYFRCDYGGHSHLADKICGDVQRISNPERHLEDLGWAKVLHGGATKKAYALGMGLDQKLTDAQLKTLQREGLEDAYGISFLL